MQDEMRAEILGVGIRGLRGEGQWRGSAKMREIHTHTHATCWSRAINSRFPSIFSHHKKYRIFTAITKGLFLAPRSRGALEESCRASSGRHIPSKCWSQQRGRELPRGRDGAKHPCPGGCFSGQMQPESLHPYEKAAAMTSPGSCKQHHMLCIQVTAGWSSAKNKQQIGIKLAFLSYCAAWSNGKFLLDLQRNTNDRFIFTAVSWRRMISKEKSFWNGQLDSATQRSWWIWGATLPHTDAKSCLTPQQHTNPACPKVSWVLTCPQEEKTYSWACRKVHRREDRHLHSLTSPATHSSTTATTSVTPGGEIPRGMPDQRNTYC